MLNSVALRNVAEAVAWCKAAKAEEKAIDCIFGLVWVEGKTMPDYDPELEALAPSLVNAMESLICAEVEANILCPATSVTDEESWDYLIERLNAYGKEN